MTNVLQIAPACPEDCREVARIHVDSWRVAYAGIVESGYLAALSIDRREAMWRDAVHTGSPRLLLARDDETITGWVAFGPCRDADAQGAGEIWALYVDPPFWSAGVGRRLLQSAVEGLVADGFRTASLWVIADNRRALRFYAAAGFAPDAGSERTFELGTQCIHELRLRKTLREAQAPAP